MKQQAGTIWTGLLILVLTACLVACAQPGTNPAAVAAPTQAQPTATPDTVVAPTQPEPAAAPAQTPESAGSAAMRDAYRAALKELLENGILPDGTDCGYDLGSDPAGNQFAISDVDGDGADELIVIYTTTAVAGQVQGIFGYDDAEKRLKTELVEYPLLTIFRNGVIRAGWSHNQGLAGEFWPFSLYRYHADEDRYVCVGMVDAWDKAFAPTGFSGEPFPDAIDVSGTGRVYYIMESDAYDAGTPVDASVYNAWYDSYCNGASEMELTFTALTVQNIGKIS